MTSITLELRREPRGVATSPRDIVSRKEFQPNLEQTRGLFSDAANDAHQVAYTITHELGHTADNAHGHTRPGGTVSRQEEENSFFRGPQGKLSRYGSSKLAAGYAESFAHYHLRTSHRGMSHDTAVDAYAAGHEWH